MVPIWGLATDRLIERHSWHAIWDKNGISSNDNKKFCLVMNKDSFLKLIATTGYNVGFGAKKHFATLDMVEKLPGWIGLASLAAGILSLFVPQFEDKFVTAAFTIIGVASITFNTYNDSKEQYAKNGVALTASFHELRMLYETVKSQPAGVDLAPFIAQHERIQQGALGYGMSKHIFLSDWYAHIKFFGQSQTDWMDEQLHFKFIKDKVPFSAKIAVIAVVIVLGAAGLKTCFN